MEALERTMNAYYASQGQLQHKHLAVCIRLALLDWKG